MFTYSVTYIMEKLFFSFFFSSRRRHTRCGRDWSSDVCSSDLLLIPLFLKRFGIKKVMIIAMFAWVLRFGFFAMGDPGSGVWMFVLSMIVYGIAFDFFNVSGSLFVDQETDKSIRSSAQGVFMMMTNGFGATIGMIGAQFVVN